MRIKNVLRIVSEIRFIKSALRRYSGSLARGRYYQHNSFRALSLDESSTREKARLYFDMNDAGSRKVAIAKKLNSIGYYKNNNKNSTEEYEAFYIANNYDKKREIKLFSFKNNKILTICTSAEEADKQIEQYERLSGAYNMPKVLPVSKYENSFEISMIDLKPFNDEKSALNNIAKSVIGYNVSTENAKFDYVANALAFSYENEEINTYMKKIADKISPDIASSQVPLCMQHGDLSKENLLYGECDGKTDFWWIDWEHVAERPFFYDFFFYIVHSAFYGHSEAFERYINGCADTILEEFFAHFGLKYEDRYRFDYLMLYFIYFLKERVCLVSGVPTLKKYYELIEAMEAGFNNEP